MTVTVRVSAEYPDRRVVVCDRCGVVHAYPLPPVDAEQRRAGHVAAHGWTEAEQVAA